MTQHNYFSLFILLNWQLTAEIVQYMSGDFAILLLLVFFRLMLVHVGLTELNTAASNALSDFDATVGLDAVINGRQSCPLRVVALTRFLLTELLVHVGHVDLLGANLVVQTSH